MQSNIRITPTSLENLVNEYDNKNDFDEDNLALSPSQNEMLNTRYDQILSFGALTDS